MRQYEVMARPRKAQLTREKVVDSAIAIIGDGGLATFSMHKLAASLGVRPPSLYHYFADKGTLLAAVARAVTVTDAVPAAPAPDADWADYLIDQAVALRARILRHPHCAPLLVQFMPRAEMFGDYEQLCVYLQAAAVPAQLHVQIVDGLTALTIGAALLVENAAHYAIGGDGPTPDRGAHPHLHQALESVQGMTPDELFALYLRTYLDGVRRDLALSENTDT
jgi:TetR/AcrR family transcriptional regulator, tetracycline repressor protein